MALIITDECINCGACVSECPNEAISEGDEIFVIDASKCTECIGWYDEPQCVEVCPVDSIVPDENNKETKEQLLEKFKKLHPDKEPKV
jgi:ferredoxin